VGCIPKKLMHISGMMGEVIKRDAQYSGWEIENYKFNWQTLVTNVQNYIRGSNFGYKGELREHGIDYINALASFGGVATASSSSATTSSSPSWSTNVITTVDSKGRTSTLTADKFVIAVGGTPNYPTDVPGANILPNCITSDDLFSLNRAPGKTLVVGASYIALECAGFLHSLGYETSVMMRSIPLRGFDRDCSERVKDYMEYTGVKFITNAVPLQVVKLDNGRVKVQYKVTKSNAAESTVEEEEFDTVLWAIGRTSVAAKRMGLEKIGVNLNAKNGKIIVNDEDQSSVPHIYAIGDCIDVRVFRT